MACAALVAALGLELEHAQLLTALVSHDLRRDLDLLQAGRVEHRVIGAIEDRLERHARALLCGKALHEQGLTPLDTVLLAACLDDRVHVYSEVACAFAAERRRPPLRPRRRGFDCRSSSPPSPCGSCAVACSPGVASPSATTSGCDPSSASESRSRAPAGSSERAPGTAVS